MDIPYSEVGSLLDELDPPKRRRKLSNIDAFKLICYVLMFGIPWSELHWQMQEATPAAVYKRFQMWVKNGILDMVWKIILERYALKHLSADPHWFQVLNVDTTMIKNVAGVDGLGRNPTDRGRLGTKMSFICDQQMVPISCQFYPANRNDVTTLEPAVDNIACTIHVDGRCRSTCAADKGYISKSTCLRPSYGFGCHTLASCRTVQ